MPENRRRLGPFPGGFFAGCLTGCLAGCLTGLVALSAPGCGGNKQDASRIRAEQLHKAEARARRGDYAGAMKILRRALDEHPEDPERLNRFALAARLRHDATSEMDFRDQELVALRKARSAMARYPVSKTLRVAILVNLSTTLWEMGMRKEAGAGYREALRWAPEHPDAGAIWRRIRLADTIPEEDEVDR